MPIGLPDDPTRAATRAPIDRPIRLQFDDSVESIEARAENLSIGGTFVTGVDEARPAGALVRFELLLDDASIRGLAEVVWARGRVDQPGASLGLKFRFLEQRDRQQIFKLVSQHIKERLAKRHAVEIDPPAMSPSVTDGTPGDQLDPLGTDLASRAERPAAVMQRPTEEQAARAVSPDEMGLSEPPRPPMQASLLDGIDDSPEVAPAVAASGFERFEPGQQAHFDAFEAPPISSRSDALVGSRDAEASGAVEWGGMEADAEGIEPPSSEDAFAASEGVAAD
ncbi:MAG: PilZ domain-containing protein, partial [Acidobacteriota bacterium]